MAAGDIVIRIDSETKAFRQGVESGIIAPLEDAESELLNLGRSRGPDQMEQGLDDAANAAEDVQRRLRDASDEADDLGKTRGPGDLEEAMRDAQRATERLGDETDDVARQIEQDFRDTYRKVRRSADDMGDEGVRNFDRMREGVSSVKEEAIANFSEVASSFSGDITEMADGVQGLTGGLAAALTPGIGIPVAVLGAAAAAWFQSWQENQEKVEEEIQEWVDAFIEGSGRIDEARVMSGVGDYLKDAERMAEVQKLVASTGLDEVTVLRALNGDLADSKAVREALADAEDNLREKIARHTEGNIELGAEILTTNAALGDAQDIWNAHAGALSTASDRFDIYADAASKGAIRSAEAAVEAGKATKKVGEFGDTVYKLPDGKKLYVDAETGQATEDIEEFRRLDIDDKDMTVRAHVDDSRVRGYRPPVLHGTVIYEGQAGKRQRG